MRRYWLLLAALATSGALADEPLALFGEMARNVRAVNYQGVFTYEQGQGLSSARIVHTVVDGLERERLEQLDGPPREYLRLDHPLSCRHEGERLLGIGEGAVPDPRIGGHYAFALEGSERVASREGRRLRVSPRDPYRYGRLLVIDEASGLPLRSETTDGAGRILERFQFVDLQVGGTIAPTAVLTGEPGSRIEADHPAEPAAPEDFGWQVAWLPEGFTLSATERRRGPDGEGSIESRMYTDGLASFAVFVERDAPPLGRPGVATHGATVAFVTPRSPGSLVSVVGNIPVDTAQLIANSVNLSRTP
jgi:sigma-E factor negative regulatory protein RseB